MLTLGQPKNAAVSSCCTIRGSRCMQDAGLECQAAQCSLPPVADPAWPVISRLLSSWTQKVAGCKEGQGGTTAVY